MRHKLNLKLLRKASYVFTAVALFSCSNEDQLETNLEQLDTEQINLDSNALSGKKISNPSKSSNCRAGNFGAQFYKVNDDANKLNPFNKDIKEIDDRTCYYNYWQQTISGRKTGIYRLKANSNHIDNIQPRIERATRRVNNSKNGNSISFEGYCTIQDVGFTGNHDANLTSISDKNGTYFIQAKGTHDNRTIGSKDPAILLLIAKPVYEPRNGNKPRKLKHYQILSEQIKKRGGSGSDRKLVKITTVRKGQRFKVTMKNYFKTKFDQRIVVNVNGKRYEFDVPNTEIKSGPNKGKRQFGNQAKIRFGAYRCQGGKARIDWDNVKQTLKN